MASSETTPPEPPVAVTRFEYNLLRLLRFLVGHLPPEQASTLLSTKIVCPPCLTAACVRLAEDTLAKGCITHLVRAGGWRREAFLRKNTPTTGRVWERIPLTERELAFGKHPLAFLLWLTTEKPTDTKERWDVPAGDTTPADDLFFAMAYENLKADPAVALSVADKRAFRDNALCRLMYPADFGPVDESPVPGFDQWTTGVRAVILECLQPRLADLWVRSERLKGQIEDWKRMRLVGTAEDATLRAFLAACTKAERPDLGRFVLTAATVILRPADLTPEFWTGGLKEAGPPRLADRLETMRSALALPRQMDTLQAWDRSARSVGYFDDNYQASQLWKGVWEAARGDALTATARRVIERVEPLRT
jgi:hypothetical protein